MTIRIGINGRAFQSPKLLIRGSPHFHMAPLFIEPDIFFDLRWDTLRRHASAESHPANRRDSFNTHAC